MPVTDEIVDILAATGIDCVFGLPSEQLEPYYASLAEGPIRHVLARSEASAALMADGYARAGGGLGVVDGVGGPGAAYAGAGLIEAAGASSPVLALTGDNDRAFRGREVIQDADNEAILAPHVAASYDPETPARAIEAVGNALREARTGVPTPVHVNLTEDVLEGDADTGVPSADSLAPPAPPGPDPDDIEAIIERLDTADRPVILAGEGVVRAGAAASLDAMASTAAIPVATSMNGKGAVDETADHSVGVAGRWGYCQVANDAVAEADCVLALGCRLGELTTVGWTLVDDDAALVHVDLDPHWLGRNGEPTLRVQADLLATIDALGRAAEATGGPVGNPSRIADLADASGTWRRSHEDELTSDREPIAPQRLVAEIEAAVPSTGLLVSATSFPGFFSGAFYRVREPGVGYIQARGSDGINCCLPQALGAQAARPDRPVIALTGDGGLGYHVADLETAVREELPVTVVVQNNAGLASSKMSQIGNWNVNVSTDFHPDVDYAAVARGFGCPGEVIEQPARLADALSSAVESDEPTLLDVRVDPYAAPPVIV